MKWNFVHLRSLSDVRGQQRIWSFRTAALPNNISLCECFTHLIIMPSVSTFTHETRPVAFSTHPLIILPIILVIVLHFFPFAVAFISRVVILTHVTVPKVVLGVVPRVFADGDTCRCPISLRDVVALGGEVMLSCIVYFGFAILMTLLLWGKPSKKQLFF